MFNIVLVEPRIPQNTGNIGRICHITNSTLHLIHPMGFVINDKNLKRAGMDYWKDINVVEYSSFEEFLSINKLGRNSKLLSTKSKKIHYDAKYSIGDYLIFGREDKGLDESIILENIDLCYKIPMKKGRSLNIANAVSIVLYEAIRQNLDEFNGNR